VIEARIDAFTRDFNRAKRFYRSGEHDAATLLIYDLCKDLSQIRSLMIDERWALSRERAGVSAGPSAPAKPGEAR
jgi:hypothetical protein